MTLNDLMDSLTDREWREYRDWAFLQNVTLTQRDLRIPTAHFSRWLDSAWGDGTVRDWLMSRRKSST